MKIGTKVRVLAGEAEGMSGVVVDNALKNGVPVTTCVRFAAGEWVIVATSDLAESGRVA